MPLMTVAPRRNLCPQTLGAKVHVVIPCGDPWIRRATFDGVRRHTDNPQGYGDCDCDCGYDCIPFFVPYRVGPTLSTRR